MQKRTKIILGTIVGIVFGLPLAAAITWLATPGYDEKRPWSSDAVDVAGAARVDSQEWTIASEAGSETFEIDSVYTVGEPGIGTGGQMRVVLGSLLPTEQRVYVPFSLTVSSAFFFNIQLLQDAKATTERDGVTLEVVEPGAANHFGNVLRYIRYKRADGEAKPDNLMRQIDNEFGVVVRVVEGELQEGDEVRLVLGATQGLVPPPREAQWQVIWQIDGDGNGTFGVTDDAAPWFVARAANTTNVRVLAPTTAVAGQPSRVTVRAEDDYFLPNLTRVTDGSLTITTKGPAEVEPISISFPASSERDEDDPLSVWEESVAHFDFKGPVPGVYRLEVSGTIDGEKLEGVSNPIVVYPGPRAEADGVDDSPVTDEEREAGSEEVGEAEFEGEVAGAEAEEAPAEAAPAWIAKNDRHVYFGDLHLHSVLSYDADRSPEYVYWRQRNQERHDFAFLTDHDMIGNPGFVDKTGLQGRTADEWNYIVSLADQWYEPQQFVTLYAHEWTSYHYGHRNIFFSPTEKRHGLIPHNRRSDSEPLDSRTPGELDEDLGDLDAMVIPHSTAWPTAGVEFAFGDPETFTRQSLFEIYSTHGTSEYFDNEYAVDKGRPEAPTDSKLVKTLMQYDIQQAPPDSGNFARDALAAGWRFGFLASSDMHFLSHIDQAYKTGWAAVWADELTREGIWEALKARRTYATTGVRIYIRFDANGEPMGSEIEAKDGVSFDVDVEGTGPLDRVQIVKYDGSEYSTLIDEEQPDSTLGYHGNAEDPDAKPGMFYYLKVRQEDGNYAWSSPIWVGEGA